MSTSRIDLGLPLAVIELLSLYGYLLRNHIGGWAFIAFASPGFLFLLHWLLRDAGEKQHAFHRTITWGGSK